MSWGAIGGAAVGVIGNAILNKQGSGSQTTTTSEAPSYMRPYLTGDRTSTEQLRAGVAPTYTPGRTPLNFDAWKQQYLQQQQDIFRQQQTQLSQFDEPGNNAASSLSYTPLSDAELQSAYQQYTQNQEFQPTLANPSSDFETRVSQYGGIYPEAANAYQQAMDQGYIGPSSTQNAYTAQEISRLNNSGLAQQIMDQGAQFQAGSYDPNLNQINMVPTPNSVAGVQNPAEVSGISSPTVVSPSGVNIQAGYESFGSANPMDALQAILSGQVDMNAIGGMQQAVANRAMMNYQDMIDAAGKDFTQNIAPSIRQGAQIAGQYGGTRQGIAEGVALSNLQDQLAKNARDLSISSMDVGTNLYGQAYQDAMARRAATAGQLSNQAGAVATTNASQDLQAQLANTGNQLTQEQINALIQQQNVANQMTTDQFNTQVQQGNVDSLLRAAGMNITVGQLNNEQELQNALQVAQNRLTGAGLNQAAEDFMRQRYSDLYGLAGLDVTAQRQAQQFPWEQLAHYAGIIQNDPSVTQTSSSSSAANPLAAAGYGMQIGQGIGDLFMNLPQQQQQPTRTPVYQGTPIQAGVGGGQATVGL